MVTREKAEDSVRKTLALLNMRMVKNPTYCVYLHAHEQLERMLVEFSHPCLEPASKREWVDIGLMAVRELELVDMDLANALMDADYDFKHAY